MYEARAICNLLLAEWQPAEPILTNLRINKLLFLVQLWSLRKEEAGIVRNHFEAWPFGPVVKSVYEEFLKYEDRQIRGLASYFDYSVGAQKYVPFDRIHAKHCSLIRNVNKYYLSFTTSDLVELTHDPYGPWAQIWSQRPKGTRVGGRIPNDLMRAYLVAGGCAKPNQ